MKTIAYNDNFQLTVDLFPINYHDADLSIDRFRNALAENDFSFIRIASLRKHTFTIIVNVQNVEVVNRLLNDM